MTFNFNNDFMDAFFNMHDERRTDKGYERGKTYGYGYGFGKSGTPKDTSITAWAELYATDAIVIEIINVDSVNAKFRKMGATYLKKSDDKIYFAIPGYTKANNKETLIDFRNKFEEVGYQLLVTYPNGKNWKDE